MDRIAHTAFCWITLAALCALSACSPGAPADLAPIRAKIETFTAGIAEAEAAAQANKPEDAKARKTQAEAALREARLLCEQAGAGRSRDVELLRCYASVLGLGDDYDLAAESLQRAVALAPGNASLWASLGENQMRIGPRWRKEAFASLKKAAALEGEAPAHPRTRVLLGDLYWAEDLPELAREQYLHAQKIAPDDVWTQIALAALDVREGRVLDGSKAIDALGKQAQPFDVETRERLREALKAFSDARRTFQDTAENHAAYARLLYRAARFPEAIIALQRATQINSADSASWNFAASLHIQLGNLAKAKEACEKSLSANPGQPDVQETLSKIEAEMRKAAVPDTPLIMR